MGGNSQSSSYVKTTSINQEYMNALAQCNLPLEYTTYSMTKTWIKEVWKDVIVKISNDHQKIKQELSSALSTIIKEYYDQKNKESMNKTRILIYTSVGNDLIAELRTHDFHSAVVGWQQIEVRLNNIKADYLGKRTYRFFRSIPVLGWCVGLFSKIGQSLSALAGRESSWLRLTAN